LRWHVEWFIRKIVGKRFVVGCIEAFVVVGCIAGFVVSGKCFVVGCVVGFNVRNV
jgi:hypothetical protein